MTENNQNRGTPMRTPTRTDLVEEHERQIATLRLKALDLITAARHYHSLAETIANLPSEGGELFIEARKDLASVAHERRRACFTKAQANSEEANRMEQEGLR